MSNILSVGVEDDLLSPKQVALILKLNVRVIYKMLNTGKLSYIEVGAGDTRKRKRVKRSVLNNYLSQPKNQEI